MRLRALLAAVGAAGLAACGAHPANPPAAGNAPAFTGKRALPFKSAAAAAMDRYFPPSRSPGTIPAGRMRDAARAIRPMWTPGGVNFSLSSGLVSQLIAQNNSTLWALGASSPGAQPIFRYWGGAWQQLPGTASRIAIAPNGETLYAVNGSGGIFAFDVPSQVWTPLAGGASDISAVALGGGIIVLSNAADADGNSAIWSYSGGHWTQLPGAGVRLSFSMDPNVYTIGGNTFGPYSGCVVNSAGLIFCLFNTAGNQSGEWLQMPGEASTVDLPAGAMFATGFQPGPSGAGLFTYDWQSAGWSALPGAGIDVVANPAQIYAISAENTVYQSKVATSVSVTDTAIAFGEPFRLIPGPNGELWFTDNQNDQVTEVTTALGTLQAFSIPTQGSGPWGITGASDGNVWFTEAAAGKIAKVTPLGTFSEFSVPTGNSIPKAILEGSDGAIWFLETAGNKVGRMLIGGSAITEYVVPTPASKPLVMTLGFDGAIWFTENAGNNIARVTTAGKFTEFAVPTANAAPAGIAPGTDGAYWFTESGANKIGRMTPAGSFTEYPLPNAGSDPEGIHAGPDGNMWFTETAGNRIGSITPGGVITEYAVPTPNGNPVSIFAGPDGSMWFNEPAQQKLGHLLFH